MGKTSKTLKETSRNLGMIETMKISQRSTKDHINQINTLEDGTSLETGKILIFRIGVK